MSSYCLLVPERQIRKVTRHPPRRPRESLVADEDAIAAPECGFRERCCERLGPKSHALEFLPRGRRNVAEDPNFHPHQFHLPASVADFVAEVTLLVFARVGFPDVALRWG